MIKEIKNIKIGADPEVFLINKETNKHISAIGLFPGNKDEPYSISDKGHGILIDNCSVEFVFNPVTTKEALWENIKYCTDYINNNCPKELCISDKVSVEFDADQLEHPDANVFGCTPSFNIYTGNMSELPDAMSTRLRSSAGHIHLGWSNPNKEQREAVVKAIDLFVTLPMVLMEEPNERRKLYGRAGEFRPKYYGVEARSPSNSWIMTEEYTHWVFDQVMEAIKWINEGNVMQIGTELSLIKAINTYDKELAQNLCNEFNINVKETLLVK
jgi:hypothetical protein